MKRAVLAFLLSMIVCPILSANDPPVLPVIDKALKAKLKSIYQLGRERGNQADVFIKVGDSITESELFLIDIGCGVATLAGYEEVKSTIQFFRRTRFPASYTKMWCDDSNSFTRDSLTAKGGFTVEEPLQTFENPLRECPPPHNTPLNCELHLMKPSIALIMLGTNDVRINKPLSYRNKLTQIVQELLLQGVIPVLSTIPPRQDESTFKKRVTENNLIIQDLASTLQVPLWNYWLALQQPAMIDQGMSGDWVHPSAYKDVQPAVFIREALRYGYNQRNLTALQALKKIRMKIQNNAPADETTTPNFTIYSLKKIPSARPGTSVRSTIKIVQINHDQRIRFRLKGEPPGVSATFKMSDPETLRMTLTVGKEVTPGAYQITILGKSSILSRTTTLSFHVS